MHPVLFDVTLAGHQLTLRSYGVLIAAGFVAGVWLSTREARRTGVDPEKIRDLCFWILVAALLGSRLVYVLANLGEFADACSDPGGFAGCTRALQLWEGGLVYYGGLAAAAIATFWFTRRHDLDFLATADLLVPSLSLGHALGRIGCWLAGCCFGRATSASWGARFPPSSLAFQDLVARGLLPHVADHTPPLHPTQLYEAAGELAIFALLLVARARKRAHGQITVAYLGLYALLRATVELFRGDAARRYIIGLSTPTLNRALGLDPSQPSLLSTSQAFSLVALAVAVALALHLRRSARST